MDKLRPIILLLAVLLLPAMTLAEERWYRVELVLFDYPTGAHQLKSEKWPAEPGHPDAGKALKLVPLAGDKLPDPPPPMQVLPAAMHELTKVVQSLARSSDYRVLLHTAWIQPVNDKAHSLPVHIQAGPLLTIEVPVTPRPDTATAPAGGTPTAATTPAKPAAGAPPAGGTTPPKPATGDTAGSTTPASKPADTTATPPMNAETANKTERREVHPLDGLITISRGRYLHVWLDMRYTRVAKYAENPATPEVDKAFFYRNVQHRRVRRKELHFIDHPAFGVLIRITRYRPQGGNKDKR